MGRCVLVVEDHPVNLELVTALLDSLRCRVLPATTAEQALALAVEERPDLILMDLQLPGMSGYEATRRLKADPRTQAVPVVAVTAHALRADEERAREAGCDAFLTKPLNPDQFHETLQRFLSAS
ncbi:MAG: response regulator [Candidatus Methylomirabilales bacterium]